MKKMIDGEIFKQEGYDSSEIKNAISQQLYINVGVIAPEQIEIPLMDLKTKARRGYYPLLNDAINLFETRGLIRLFNLSSANGGRSKIPTTIPYLRAYSRNRYKEGDSSMNNNGHDTTLFFNMYRIGNWNADDTEYIGLAGINNLYASLESAVIGYKLLVEGQESKIFNDKIVLEYLTKIYVFLFSQAMKRAKTSFGSEFNQDAAAFVIAKFFLLYVLEKPNTDFVDDYAYLVVENHSSLESLKSFEENSAFEYDSLTKFLRLFGEAFYNGESVYLQEFENSWVQLFGESTGLAVEFAPFLIHFLFAVFHSANLGGTLRLSRQQAQLNKNGLPRLYNAVINALK